MSATLLCVQHDRELGRLYAEALTAEGYEVLRANDGRGALEILKRQNPSLVVLDLYLPRQDGFEVLAEMRVRPECKTLPVLLFCNGDVTDEIRSRAKTLGAFGVESAPVETDRLVARVAEQIGSPEEKPATTRQHLSEGSLKEIPIPDLLHGLHIDALDGVLLLDHGRKKKAVEFRGGWPVSVKSNLISECLGSYLVEHGRCSKNQLAESIERMRAGEGLQGEILVAMDVLDEDAVVEALQAHAQEKFLEVFSWRGGQFKFRRGAHVQRGSSFGIEGHPLKLIAEGIRGYFPLKEVDRYFAVYQDAFLVPLKGRQDQLAQMELTAEEATWLRGLDGSVSLGALLELSESIRRIAFALISLELFGVESSTGAGTQVTLVLEDVVNELDGVQTSPGSKTDEELRVELAELANGMQNKDHYGALGVASTATDAEIETASAGLTRQAHPDRFHTASSSVRQLASQVFDRIAQAHSAIATEADRKNYAMELSQGRRVTAAEDEGRRALQAETEFQRGEKLVAKRNYEGALVCFGRAMENYPSEGEYRSHYGWCLYLCHPDSEVMLSEALEHCRRGVKLAKDREKPYLLLGRLYKATGRPVAAKKMFTRAVTIRPQCVEAMRELRIMNMRRDKQKGVLKRMFRR
jgi:CheY-like chemotaxis protein/tetratricopeptide (TPR) repeat protein